MSTFPAFCLGILLVSTQPETAPTAQAAAQSLAAEYTDLVPALIEALGDRENDVRNSASSALVALGSEAVPGLLKAIEGEDDALRIEAARVLGQMANGIYVAREAVPVLLKALKDDDPGVRAAASYAIQQLVTNSKGARAQPFGGGFLQRRHRGSVPQQRN